MSRAKCETQFMTSLKIIKLLKNKLLTIGFWLLASELTAKSFLPFELGVVNSQQS
jgi:hypothetical protein